MKILLNKCHGGFGISEFAERVCSIDPNASLSDIRVNPDLIDCIEISGADAFNGRYAELRIAEIPDEATDWEVEEYDGFEWLTYVVDGKLYHK